jgi:hypothetical protein
LAIEIIDFPIRNLPALKPIPLPTSSPHRPGGLVGVGVFQHLLQLATGDFAAQASEDFLKFVLKKQISWKNVRYIYIYMYMYICIYVYVCIICYSKYLCKTIVTLYYSYIHIYIYYISKYR